MLNPLKNSLWFICVALLAVSCGKAPEAYLRPAGLPEGAGSLAVFPSQVTTGYMEQDGMMVCERCQCDGYKTGLLIKDEAARLSTATKVKYYHRPDLEARGIEIAIWEEIENDKLVLTEASQLGELSDAGLVLLSNIYCWEREDRTATGAQSGGDSFNVRSGGEGKPVKVRDKIGVDLVLIDTDSGEIIWRMRHKLKHKNKQRLERHTHVYDSATTSIRELMKDFPLRPVEAPAEGGEAEGE